MTVDDAVELSASIPALVGTLIGLNPAAAASPIVWCGPADRQRDLFDAVTGGRDVPEEVQSGVVLAMLQAKSDAVADRAVRRFGSTAVSTVLCWFDESGFGSPADLPGGWRRAISARPSSLLDWMAASPSPREPSAALVADLLNPHSTEVHSKGAGLWVGPTSPAGALPEADRIRFHVFLLALGFDNPPGPADELVVRSFAIVHQALADDVLRYDSWAMLEDQLPRLSWTKNWDKCERLRRGLAQSFAMNEWPVPQFFRCAEGQGHAQADAQVVRQRRRRRALFQTLPATASERGVPPGPPGAGTCGRIRLKCLRKMPCDDLTTSASGAAGSSATAQAAACAVSPGSVGARRTHCGSLQ